SNTDIDYNNKLTIGKNIAYWISPSCEYTTSIPNAKNRIMYPSGMSNPIILWKTNVNSDSKMDFYQYYSNDTVNAYAMCFRKNSNGVYYNCTSQKDSYDWVYGEIYINDRAMNSYSNNVREIIIMHEMLHVYGCKDINNPNSIMHYNNAYFSTKVNGLTSDANQVLNNKYNY
ncbi:MAG: hypothetical protein K5917_05305, partial [Clostridiales bacterium]|nr:hypothetical protein [Clostridiales bacterium]